jgi:hypothetical protein
MNISTGSQVSRIVSGVAPGDYQNRPFLDGRFANITAAIYSDA